jgi:hypothetical protein
MQDQLSERSKEEKHQKVEKLVERIAEYMRKEISDCVDEFPDCVFEAILHSSNLDASATDYIITLFNRQLLGD